MVSAPTAWGVRSLSFAPMYWGGGSCLSREFMPVCLSLCLRVLLCLCVCVCVCVLVFLCDKYCLTLHLIVSWIWVVVSLTCYSHLFHLKWYLSLDLGLKKKSSAKSFLKTSKTFWAHLRPRGSCFWDWVWRYFIFLNTLKIKMRLSLPALIIQKTQNPPQAASLHVLWLAAAVVRRQVQRICRNLLATFIVQYRSKYWQKIWHKSAKKHQGDTKSLFNTFLMPPAVTDKHTNENLKKKSTHCWRSPLNPTLLRALVCYQHNVFIVIERKDFNDVCIEDIKKTNLSLMLIPPSAAEYLLVQQDWCVWSREKKQGI